MAEYNTGSYYPKQHIDCQSLLSDPKCNYSGWLRKYSFRNKLKIFTWPQVYVVLCGGCVYYFGSEFAKHSHSFSLFGYSQVIRETEMQEALWVYKIIHAHPEFKTYYFSASSEKEQKDWMTRVKNEMDIANNVKKKKRGKADGKDVDEESLTYQDIEEGIYEDAKFSLPKDYTNKRKSEVDSDDDMDGRPPAAPPVPSRQVRRKKSAASNGSRSYATPEKHDPHMTTLQSDLKQRLQVDDTQDVSPTIRDRPRRDLRERGDGVSVVCDQSIKEMELTQEDYWASIYFDEVESKTEATEVLRKIAEDGVYLVRKSADGSFTLCFYAITLPRKIKIKEKDKKFYIKEDSYLADSIEELVYFYYSNNLPISTITKDGVKLEMPYKLHPKHLSSK